MPIMALGTVFLVVGAGACADRREPKVVSVSESLAESPKWSAGLRAWALSDSHRSTTVLIRANGVIGAKERHALEQAGVEVISTAGDVLTGTVCRTALIRASRFDFVRYMELSLPLRLPHGSLP